MKQCHYHHLAASTSQGLVSVWHLASQSPLLRHDSRLLPVQTWLAHTGSASQVWTPGYCSTKSHPVISQNSAVTNLGVSQWLGCMAVTTSAGELILFVMPSLERSLKHDKNLDQRRVYVDRTESSRLRG